VSVRFPSSAREPPSQHLGSVPEMLRQEVGEAW
jgi:hypothetical protein